MKHPITPMAARIIAAMYRAAQSGDPELDVGVVERVAAMLDRLDATAQLATLRAVGVRLGVIAAGPGDAAPSPSVAGRRAPDRARASRAQLVAREGELDVSDARHLARAFGQPVEGGPASDASGVAHHADGRVSLSVLSASQRGRPAVAARTSSSRVRGPGVGITED